MKSSMIRIAVLAGLLCAVALIIVSLGKGIAPSTGSVQAASAAEVYCGQSGGEPVRRIPVYGTNGSDPLPLSGARMFCGFHASDGSRIHILVDTLYTQRPTLAALAYYAQVPPQSGCQGNPASCYCTQLGGSDLFGGINAAGGGWVNEQTVDQTLEACIFPDMSSIDSWGLFYYSAGIIRGKDLSTVLRYPNPYKTKRR
ncbi:MAG TPA: hypothetical protein VFA89_18360 [Terriglobales bacterium]|nr:hypothetical protein [Terriglobales bacterium]